MGWAISPYYDYLTPNKNGQIWETRDGGNTWQLRHDTAKTFFRSVGFADSLNGWIGNLADSTVTPDKTPLFETHDGGRTIIPVSFNNPVPKGICGISVVTDSVIYAYGRYYGPAVLAWTTDKGNKWKTQSMSGYATGLVDGKFFTKDTGFITGCNGNNGVILYTVNGGSTWSTVYQGTRNDSEIVWKIVFPSRDTGYPTIEYIGALAGYKTYFVTTTDGGKTWTEHPFMLNYDEEGIGFINDTVGWLGGDLTKPTYKTTNGGKSWKVDSTFGVLCPPYQNSFITAFDINRFRRFGDTLMYASGNTVYKYSNHPVGINEIHEGQLSVSNYPNPFTYQTTIAFNCTEAMNHVMLTVTDIAGQTVYVKELGQQSPGRHLVNLSLQLQAGLYFYSIQTDNYRVTNKMTVVK